MIRLRPIVLIVLALSSCAGSSRCHGRPTSDAQSDSPDAAPDEKTTVRVSNTRATSTVVYVSFGADSVVRASDWSSFCAGGGGSCSFTLAGHAKQPLPTGGRYLNATISFDGSGCGATKGEVNVNNPSWYDILDVSLVDGYSNDVKIVATPSGADASAIALGPPVGQTGNEKVFGLYPYGCDVCVERQNPPCGIARGKDGCKKGTQYAPDVPCQWQGTIKGGGGLSVSVELL
jgi:hypothetical protein